MKLGINLIGWALDKVMKKPPLISREQLRKIAKYATDSNIDLYLSPINNTLTKYQINTPLRMCHFLAQILHESGSFRYKEEIASGEAYEGRIDLGNTQAGDGRRFKGRGLIQITGRANYQQYADYRQESINFILEQATHHNISADIAGWYWMTRGLNTLADADDLLRITKRINGGYNGLKDRAAHLERAKAILLP